MKKLILGFIFTLAACSSYQKQNITPSDFIGQNQSFLFEYYGAPDSVYHMTALKHVWVYQKTNLSPVKNPYTNEFLYQGWQEPQYGLPEVPNTYDCTYYFTIENAIVTNYSFNGDDC